MGQIQKYQNNHSINDNQYRDPVSAKRVRRLEPATRLVDEKSLESSSYWLSIIEMALVA